MSNATPLTRAERLAAKLRENLRRRKVQARALDAAVLDTEGPSGDEADVAVADGLGLSKSPPTR